MEVLMLYSRYIRLVEEHAEKLTSQWITEVKSNSATLQYRQFSDQELVHLSPLVVG